MKSDKVTDNFSECIFQEIYKSGRFVEFAFANGNGYLVDQDNNRFIIKSNIGYFVKENKILSGEESSFNYIIHYQKDAEEFDYFEERFGETAHDERRLMEFITFLVPDDVDKILDAGCGKAWVAGHYCPKGINVCSLDVATINVEKAKELYNYPNHAFVVSDLLNLPFPDNIFDCIICSEVLEHIVEPKSLINELFRCVKAGGYILLSTPYKEKINYALCIHCNQKTPINAHLHSFDEYKLENLLSDLNLEELKYYKFGNKFLQYIRHHVLFSFFPFWFWRIFDGIFNLIYNKPTHIILKFKKGGV